MHLFDISCPNCEVKCWVNNGDTTDLTVADIEAICCWKCHHLFLIDPEEEDEELIEDKLISNSFQFPGEAIE